MAINQWQNNKRLMGELVAVRDVKWTQERTKGPKLTLELFDNSGFRRAKMWNASPEQAQQLVDSQTANPPLVRVFGTVDGSGSWAGEVTLDGVTPVEADDPDVDQFLADMEILPPDHATTLVALDRLITGVREPYFSQLLERTIGNSGKIRHQYVTATAAKKNHHAYPGGLVRHSVEVAHLSVSTMRQYPTLNRDLLVTAALLHDIGKLWEMEQTQCRRGQYTDSGKRLGHIFQGGTWLDRCCRTLHFPDVLREDLIHAVLAHHDQLEFGSPVLPQSAEAVTIAKCDQISAELAPYMVSTTVATLSDETMLLPDDPEERLLRRLAGLPQLALPTEWNDTPAVALPILGVVAAGDGIRSSSDEGPEPERRDVVPPIGGADFLLRVVGDSMIGAGIIEGDLLVVRRQETARVGEIVVAHVPGTGPVVKRLMQNGDERVLHSENPEYSPLPITEEVQVQGIVVRVERDLL